MKKFLVLCLLLIALCSGCPWETRGPEVLPESDQLYIIPAGTPFKAKLSKDGPLQDVVRHSDTWGVDAGVLLRLQMEANRRETGD